ncbi:type II CAAX endopeptidase family protein [Haloferula sargassicola]|uniref:CAAX prenyl protease 2/Lysostaphin resistance protein A-like domain-containing protein n=1 Tax=Haloferula sargassicola TaxID=490096 RepID=A0ABP9UKF7_9BACT
MSTPGPTPPFRVWRALWKAARRRSAGRAKRQRELTQQRKRGGSDVLGGLASVIMVLFSLGIHGCFGLVTRSAVENSALIHAERAGQPLVPDRYLSSLRHDLAGGDDLGNLPDHFLDDAAEWRIENLGVGGPEEKEAARLRTIYEAEGVDGFRSENEVVGRNWGEKAFFSPAQWSVLGLMIGWWFLMLVFQGEGMELDVQRRRHPMWEWLATHPIRPWSGFLAEMLAPYMANPIYGFAPVYWMVLGGSLWDPAGMAVGLPVGFVFGIAASALSKALEAAVLIRLSPLNRGAVLGLASWLGYVGLFLPILLLASPGLLAKLLRITLPLAEVLPSAPLRTVFLGHPAVAAVGGTVLGIGLAAAAIGSVAWSLKDGVQPSAGAGETVRSADFTRRPWWKKEWLWLSRDRGAVVQAFLVPMTIAAVQLFNLRHMIASSSGSWNGLAGVAVLFGTYFLFVLGPRSLASEGSALWIALTWPKDLERLLKAKARSWFLLASVVVVPFIAFAIWRFPADWPWLLFTAVGWIFFGTSLAEKSVTLVSVISPSGEAEPIPASRRWAAIAGTFAFAAGLMSGAWSIAVLGVVFSLLSSAAMWQGFRARLPYLFDPWSEREPPAPSLVQAMVGIAILVECVGTATAIGQGFGGDEVGWMARTISYGVIGLIGFLVMARFLHGKGVSVSDIVFWERQSDRRLWRPFGWAVLLAPALAGIAWGYLFVLRHLPATAGYMETIDRAADSLPGARPWLAVMAIAIAPPVEEYFFRGLLFRSLCREWRPAAAMLGSAAYFALYHPPVSWLPVFGLGAASAWLFRRCGSLWPSILLHAGYNALVTLVR